MKAILFDVDGVLTVPQEVFSVIYSRSHGLDVEPFSQFFSSEWIDFVIGKRDLKQHISDNPSFWHWDGTPDELLTLWFEMEDVRNEELLRVIKKLRATGRSCYIVTEQEKYRTEYIRSKMFAGMFDGVFSTAEIGYRKTDKQFYEYVLDEIGTAPSEVLFFDDSESKVRVAASLGIDARLYREVGQVRKLLSA